MVVALNDIDMAARAFGDATAGFAALGAARQGLVPSEVRAPNGVGAPANGAGVLAASAPSEVSA
jgi:hypothetical protein